MRTLISCLLIAGTATAAGADRPLRVDPEVGVEYENSGGKEQGGDMPWRTQDGNIRGVAYVKDANEAPIAFDYLRLYETTTGRRVLVASDESDRTVASDLTLWSLDLAAGPPGTTREFEWEFRFRDLLSPFWVVTRYVNRVRVAAPLPTRPDWYRFDLHLHSFATDTQFEFGMTVPHMAAALTSVGLDGAFFTDHGESVTDARWAALTADCAAHTSPSRLLAPAIEGTVDDDLDDDFPDGVLHLTCLGLSRPLKTPAEYFSANQASVLWTLPQLLDSLEAQDAVCFAAHPEQGIQLFEFNLLAAWPDTAYAIALASPAFLGLQLFNQRITVFDDPSITSTVVDPFGAWQTNPAWPGQYDDGMRRYHALVQDLWAQAGGDPLLVRRLFFCGGSDAHGDLNFKRHNALGQFDAAANDDAIGVIHTALMVNGELTETAAIDAMRAGRMVVSDGPLLVPRLRLPDGSSLPVGSRLLDPAGVQLELDGESLDEFGRFNRVFVVRVTAAAVDTLPLALSGLQVAAAFGLEGFATDTGALLIVEAHTTLGYRSVANGFWVGPATATSAVGPAPPRTWLGWPEPNPTSRVVRLPFSVASPRTLSITVYDLRGRIVRTLEPARQLRGRSEVIWDGRDRRGVPVGSGVYLVELHVWPFRYTRKVVLLRR